MHLNYLYLSNILKHLLRNRLLFKNWAQESNSVDRFWVVKIGGKLFKNVTGVISGKTYGRHLRHFYMQRSM